MGKFTAYKLPLKSLAKGSHDFSYHLDRQFFADMESTDIRDADLEVKLVVKYDGNIYDLDFTISGDITVACDRCLDDLHLPVDETYHIMVKYGEVFNDSSDDMLEIPESDNFLNVAYMLYDTVTLAIPIKHVHPAGKCNRAMSAVLKRHSARAIDDYDDEDDLMDETGQTETEEDSYQTPSDPRWDALKNL